MISQAVDYKKKNLEYQRIWILPTGSFNRRDTSSDSIPSAILANFVRDAC
jgi:hypothetical protein